MPSLREFHSREIQNSNALLIFRIISRLCPKCVWRIRGERYVSRLGDKNVASIGDMWDTYNFKRNVCRYKVIALAKRFPFGMYTQVVRYTYLRVPILNSRAFQGAVREPARYRAARRSLTKALFSAVRANCQYFRSRSLLNATVRTTSLSRHARKKNQIHRNCGKNYRFVSIFLSILLFALWTWKFTDWRRQDEWWHALNASPSLIDLISTCPVHVTFPIDRFKNDSRFSRVSISW